MYTDTDNRTWQIVPYGGNTAFKKVRVRDGGRIRQIVRHLQANECVSLIGPPFSEKSRLLDDVAEDTHGHRLGVIVVERFVEGRNPHELPGQLPDLVHFLEHAAGAIENVLVRAAYREIGEAVLDASTVQPSLQRMLEVAAGAPGCDAAHLYLLDPGQALLEPAAGVGQLWNADWQALHRLAANGDHPAAACLCEGRMRVMRGNDKRLSRGATGLWEGRAESFRAGPAPHTQQRPELQGGHAGLAAGTRPGGALASPESGAAELLKAFAAHATVAIDNARLHEEEIKQQRLEQELIVDQAIQQSLLPLGSPQVPG